MGLTELLDPTIAGPASRFVLDQQQDSLSDAVEQLAGLRFSILLSARWESSSVLGSEARNELRDELRQFRTLYSNKIDEIAMTHGVQAAIAAKESVEREVAIPRGMMPPLTPASDDRHYFSGGL